jgi:hypothetical protein
VLSVFLLVLCLIISRLLKFPSSQYLGRNILALTLLKHTRLNHIVSHVMVISSICFRSKVMRNLRESTTKPCVTISLYFIFCLVEDISLKVSGFVALRKHEHRTERFYYWYIKVNTYNRKPCRPILMPSITLRVYPTIRLSDHANHHPSLPGQPRVASLHAFLRNSPGTCSLVTLMSVYGYPQ